MEAQLYYGGRGHPGIHSRIFAVDNPATNEVIGNAVLADPDDVSLAVDAASQAFPQWSRSSFRDRSHVLLAIYQAITDHREELARLLTQEEGKSLAESDAEIRYGARFFEYYAAQVFQSYGHMIFPPMNSHTGWTAKVPVGVAVLITPWNYPFAMICRKMAPALAAGCTVVVKPAEQTPLIAWRFFSLLHTLALQPGVINLVTGDPEVVGPALIQDKRVRKISFTGSTAVGRRILSNAAKNITSVSLELGGNAPFIVFDDANIDDAIAGIMACKFRNAGQICVAANRIYVQRSIAPKVIRQLVKAATGLVVGNGMAPNTQIGPLINQDAIDKVITHLHDAEDKGAQVEIGGLRRPGPGYFFEPTIVTGVNEGMLLVREETFGPVAPLSVFDTEEDAFQTANNTPYGLSAYVYTTNLGRAMRASQLLEFGLIGINDPIPSRVEAPIGGWKESGLGREGGDQGIEEFLETKYVSMRF